MKVIFEPLEREKWWVRLQRYITNNTRDNEHIRLTMNGSPVVIKRGIVVDVPSWVPKLALKAPERLKYNCYVLYQERKKG